MVQEGTNRYKNSTKWYKLVQKGTKKGTRRYKKVQEGTKRYKKVQKGTKRSLNDN